MGATIHRERLMPHVTLASLPTREVFPGFVARFVHSAHMTMAYWDVRAGGTVPAHSHPQEQIVTVLEGDFEMTIGGETVRLGPGSVAVIQSNVTHSARAITSCRIIDSFHPVRQDYRQ